MKKKRITLGPLASPLWPLASVLFLGPRLLPAQDAPQKAGSPTPPCFSWSLAPLTTSLFLFCSPAPKVEEEWTNRVGPSFASLPHSTSYPVQTLITCWSQWWESSISPQIYKEYREELGKLSFLESLGYRNNIQKYLARSLVWGRTARRTWYACAEVKSVFTPRPPHLSAPWPPCIVVTLCPLFLCWSWEHLSLPFLLWWQCNHITYRSAFCF